MSFGWASFQPLLPPSAPLGQLLQESRKNRVPFGQSAFPSQAHPWSSSIPPVLLCGTGLGSRGSWGSTAIPAVPRNSAHLHTLPPKGWRASDPHETIPTPTLEENRKLCSTLKISYFFQMGSCSAVMQALGGQWIFIWILNEPLDKYLQEVEALRLSPSIFKAVHTYTTDH